MTPLKIGACLTASEISDHRDWLFDDERDIEPEIADLDNAPKGGQGGFQAAFAM